MHSLIDAIQLSQFALAYLGSFSWCSLGRTDWAFHCFQKYRSLEIHWCRLKPRLEMDVTVDGSLHPNQHHLPLMLFMIGIAGRLRWFRMIGVVIDVYEIDWMLKWSTRSRRTPSKLLMMKSHADGCCPVRVHTVCVRRPTCRLCANRSFSVPSGGQVDRNQKWIEDGQVRLGLTIYSYCFNAKEII